MALALYRKYRPTQFSSVAGQDMITRTLLNQLKASTVAHAYLFTGPRGTGKTSTARLLAKAVNCLEPKDGEPCEQCSACVLMQTGNALDIIEIDAASNTQVEKVRDVIVEGVRFAPSTLKRKVYIIDEVHMLSSGSFNALLKTLEEPPDHALFILATTEIHKVPATIISRCQRFDFRRIPAETIVQTLKQIAKSEGVEVEEQVYTEVARHADGGMRDAESVFGQMLALAEGSVTMREAALVLPVSSSESTFGLLEAVADQTPAIVLERIQQAVEQGIDVPQLTSDLIEATRVVMLSALGATAAGNEVFDETSRARLHGVAARMGAARAAQLVSMLSDARLSMKSDVIPQLSLELALVQASLPQEASVAAPVAPPTVPKPPMGSVSVAAPKPAARPVVEAPPVDTMSESSLSPVVTAEVAPVAETSVAAETPPVEPATAFGGAVPVLHIEEVRSRWPDVFQMLKGANASLPIVIKAGDVTGIDGDRIEVSFAYAMHADMVNQDRNRRILEPVLERVYGKKMSIKGKYVHQESDETVSMLLQEFGGSAA